MRLSIILVIAALVFGCSKKNVSFSNIPQESWLEKHVEKKLKKIKVDKKQEIVVETPLSIEERVFFELDSDYLASEWRGVLDLLVKELEDYPNARIVLEGNCCPLGSNGYNYRLGLRRGNSVYKYLNLQLPDFSEGQIVISSKGEENAYGDDLNAYPQFRNCKIIVSE